MEDAHRQVLFYSAAISSHRKLQHSVIVKESQYLQSPTTMMEKCDLSFTDFLWQKWWFLTLLRNILILVNSPLMCMSISLQLECTTHDYCRGEYGMGTMANELSLGCDCLGQIHYLVSERPRTYVLCLTPVSAWILRWTQRKRG